MNGKITPELQDALCDKLLALADDELILAHRNSEWTGHGPILEEDIAFSNIALDEMGHATIWYELLEGCTGKTPDEMVFFRDAEAFRNVQMVELPKGDWGFSILRQYLFDSAETIHLNQLLKSSHDALANAAAKIRQEEIYHLRHTGLWVQRLGLGTAESHGRLQRALDELWPYAQQLFVPLLQDELLVEAGIIPQMAAVHEEWLAEVRPYLQASDLTIPANDRPPATSRTTHTHHLTSLLAEMQMVARTYPDAEW